jgi:hypothetical protein
MLGTEPGSTTSGENAIAAKYPSCQLDSYRLMIDLTGLEGRYFSIFEVT